MPQLIAGNWKMHGLTADAVALAKAVAAGAAGLRKPASCWSARPSSTSPRWPRSLRGAPVAVGGQNCHQAKQGAHTGDISAPMLRDVGATWVILGHSERRQNHGETDELVREKVLAAVDAGLTPIVCVGETSDQRAGGQETEVVGWQLAGSLPKPFTGVVAYEPVWAIGTGKNATEQDVATMHAFIREELVRQFGEAGQGIRILYGGSVRPANAASLLAVPHVGGALVGGASLKADDFLAIARAGRQARGRPCKPLPRGGEVGTVRRGCGPVAELCSGRNVRTASAPTSPAGRGFCKDPAMTTVLLIIHLFVTLALIGVVLIQRSEGGGLGIGTSQGMGAFMSGRGTANLLTRATAILATVFMALSLTLALMNRGTSGVGGHSILDPAPRRRPRRLARGLPARARLAPAPRRTAAPAPAKPADPRFRPTDRPRPHARGTDQAPPGFLSPPYPDRSRATPPLA